MLRRGSQKVSRDTGFPLFEAWDSGFLSKIRARFGIDGICGTELGGGLPKTPRDYGIEEPFWGPFKNDSLLQSLGLHYQSPSLSVLGSFILTHILFGHFLILLPYKGTELIHTYSCYTVGF